MIIDYSILTQFTVAELDVIQDRLDNKEWPDSETRRLLLQREQVEIDIVLGLVDNRFGLPLMSKAAEAMKKDRGD